VSNKEPAASGGEIVKARRRYPAINEDSRKILLERISEGHTLKDAVAAAGVSHRRRVLELRDADAEFAAAYEEAWANGNDALIEEARRRAMDGWDEPVVSAGKLVTTVRKYDSRLLERLLAARIPAFRNQPQTTLNVSTGVDGTNVTVRQIGVSFDDVAAVLAKAGALKRFGVEALEAPEGTAEVVSVTDESEEQGSSHEHD